MELPGILFIQERLHPKTAEDTLQINPQEAVLGRLPEYKWCRIMRVLNSSLRIFETPSSLFNAILRNCLYWPHLP